jgi:putative peptide zinc metalloprotease protein
MDSALFHPQWYRIAELHPRLRGHVNIRRQVVRDQVWYVLRDPVDGRHFRLNPMAYRFVGLCDGERSVQQVWEHMVESLGDDAPTQADLVNILGRLSEGDLLQTEALPDVDILFENRTVRRDKQRWSQLNPLFFRVGLFDPTPYLRVFDPWLSRLFCAWSLLLWSLLVGVAGVMALVAWPELTSHAAERVSSPVFLLFTWLVYPFIKTLHELGHALAIRRWGGEVRKVGITLLVLMPIPWVDASASNGFRFRGHRLSVSAAGIMVELLLASLAMILWAALEPGLARDASLAVMLIAGVSTLFFNGNPLMRYDGYFMLSDAIDLPNLAPHSANYWVYLAKRYLLRLDAERPLMAGGERFWLLLYGPASFLYRVFIALLLLLWFSGISTMLASIAGAVLLWTLFVKPGEALYRSLWQHSGTPGETRRAKRVATGVLAVGVLLVMAMPLPLRIIADGIVWLPEQARVRPETDGFVVRILVADGGQVQVGQPLLELRDPDLLAERDKLYAQLANFQSEQYGSFQREPEKARNLAEQIDSLQAAIRLNESRLASLTLRAGSAGRFVLPRQNDLPDSFIPRGTEVGYILDASAPRIRAILSQQDVALTRERMRGAEVWLRESAQPVAALSGRAVPAATTYLPSAALGDRGGGGIVTDPKDEKGITALEPVFLLDLDLPDRRVERVGARVKVRFDLGSEALAAQIWRRLRQMFLSQFSKAG